MKISSSLKVAVYKPQAVSFNYDPFQVTLKYFKLFTYSRQQP